MTLRKLEEKSHREHSRDVEFMIIIGESDQSAQLYTDHNATTKPLPEVVECVTRTMNEVWANPSSAHRFGDRARTVLESARDGVCELLGGTLPEGIVFTSGGTEANNTVLLGCDPIPAWRCVITSRVEHASILRPADVLRRRDCRVAILDVSSDGIVDPDALRRAAVAAPVGPLLVSLQWANSETGVIQPVSDLVAAVRSARPDALIHSDAAQAVGRVRIDLASAGVDAISFSSHKIHGPQGTGALVLADPDDARIAPLVHGGGQERGLRSGTHNLPCVAGLGLAALIRARSFDAAVASMRDARDAFEEEIVASGAQIEVNGCGAQRLPNTSNIRFPGQDGMKLTARLDAVGIACSQGSACSSAKPEPSHVLRAMGLSEADAYSSIRFSFSAFDTVAAARNVARMVVGALEGSP